MEMEEYQIEKEEDEKQEDGATKKCLSGFLKIYCFLFCQVQE